MTNQPSGSAGPVASVRTGLSTDAIAQAIIDNLHCQLAKPPHYASPHDWYVALAYTVRDRMMDRYIRTLENMTGDPSKVVAYLSAEFLMGPHLGNGLINLGIWDATEQALASLGQDLQTLLAEEEEPGLGNGGLGRLAACYMDSLATLNVQAIGYGLRYEFGIFDQAIRDGWQVELTDKWLRYGNPWEIARPEWSRRGAASLCPGGIGACDAQGHFGGQILRYPARHVAAFDSCPAAVDCRCLSRAIDSG